MLQQGRVFEQKLCGLFVIRGQSIHSFRTTPLCCKLGSLLAFASEAPLTYLF